MVRAYHLILTAYGFWLPNDPRGSWSTFVRAWDLRRFGPVTKVETHRSVAKHAHDVQLRHAAKRAMARPAVRFSGEQALLVARGFADYVQRSGCVAYACAVMPVHAHLVLARHTCTIERMANLLKGAATARLKTHEQHPFAGAIYRNGRLPTPWARGQWACYLNTDHDICRAVRYVEANPVKDGLRPQHWSFVTPLVG